MTSILPPFPRFVMTILEPISLIAGAVAPFISPEWFTSEQIAGSPVLPLTENSSMVAYQLGNMYLLMCLVGIAVLNATTEPKVVRNYVIALWLADITHVLITGFGLGMARVMDVASWNSMTWGNIGATIGLFLTRTFYLLGLFGPDREPALGVGKKKQ